MGEQQGIIIQSWVLGVSVLALVKFCALPGVLLLLFAPFIQPQVSYRIVCGGGVGGVV